MIRGLEGEKLDGWLEEAEASEAEVMKKFAIGLKKDLEAVRAGLTESFGVPAPLRASSTSSNC
jgi:hypothetical protein